MKPENPYRKNTLLWSLMECDWSDLTMDQIEKSPFAAYFVDHTTGVWPSAAPGMPLSAATFQCTGRRSKSAHISPESKRKPGT